MKVEEIAMAVEKAKRDLAARRGIPLNILASSSLKKPYLKRPDYRRKLDS
jgi:hypothetical protein